MSENSQGTDGSSFRRPASYRRSDLADRLPSVDGGTAHTEDPEATAPAPLYPEDETKTVLLGGDAPQARPQAQPQPQPQARPPQPPRVDQTLVAPAMRGRVAAEERSRQERAYAYGQAASDAAHQRLVRHRPVRQIPRGRQQAVPYGQASQPPVMAPRGYIADDLLAPPRRPSLGRRTARGILLLLSWAFRICALALVALVVLNSLTLGNRLALMQVTARVTQLLPRQLSGVYVLDTPFGGAFRGDFAIMAVILFVLDWICARIRRSLW